GRLRSTSLTASPRRYLRTVFLEIFSSLAIARMLIPRRDKILISTTASFVSIQGPPLLNPDGPDFQQRWVSSFVPKGSVSGVRSQPDCLLCFATSSPPTVSVRPRPY